MRLIKLEGCTCGRGIKVMLIAVILIFLSIANGSCFFGTKTNPCEDVDWRCRSGQVCAPNGDIGVCVNIGGCGDGTLNADRGEECDDGNLNNGDKCSSICHREECGNGIVDVGEGCDLGSMNSDDGECLINCQKATCGDEHVWTGHEDCDLGLVNSNTGNCLENCKNATCGDGYAWTGHEECDLGLGNSNTGNCLENCKNATCGDGYVRETQFMGMPPEVCDDANPSCGTCNASCNQFKLAKATGRVVVVEAANIIDGETFILNSGLGVEKRFEFDKDGNFDAMKIRVDITTIDAPLDEQVVRNRVIRAVNDQAELEILAFSSSPGNGVVRLEHERFTALGNVPIRKSNPNSMIQSFGMDGGAGGDCGSSQPCRLNQDCRSNVCMLNNMGSKICQ